MRVHRMHASRSDLRDMVDRHGDPLSRVGGVGDLYTKSDELAYLQRMSPLQQAVADAITRHGVVPTARAIGSTPQTLKKYLAGAAMRPATLAMIERWVNPDAVDAVEALHDVPKAPAPPAAPPVPVDLDRRYVHRDGGYSRYTGSGG